MKSITEVSNLENKRVILRLDLNVPLKNQEIQDETRILKILPVNYNYFTCGQTKRGNSKRIIVNSYL
jgi:3-phosphoglycerate kinase